MTTDAGIPQGNQLARSPEGGAARFTTRSGKASSITTRAEKKKLQGFKPN